MKSAMLNYLNFVIRISLPDPQDSNTIYVEIHRQAGTYDPNEYNSYLTDYQFSAESSDPNEWVIEGVKSAIGELNGWGVKFYQQRSEPVAAVDGNNTELDDIPF